MDKIKNKLSSWWQDGISFKETIAMILILIFGYSVYIACKKMMIKSLDCFDIEFYKILSTQVIIILCFYFGGSSAENIINCIFNKSKKINSIKNVIDKEDNNKEGELDNV